MAKVSHKQRIIDLIELNKSDVEIKKTIYNEYNIVVSLSDIESKRNTNYIIEFKENKNQEIENKIKLVKELLNENYYNPLTKKAIVNKIHATHHIYLTQNEIKEILWTRLRSEIVYDKDEWTYRLKNKLINEYEVDNIQNKENLFSTKNEIKSSLNFDLEIFIDNSKFKIYKKKEFFKPIFYYNFNSSNGDNEIIINLSHELYKPEYEEFIIKIACSMYFTKSSMTSNVIDIYINRLLSNLALIHE